MTGKVCYDREFCSTYKRSIVIPSAVEESKNREKRPERGVFLEKELSAKFLFFFINREKGYFSLIA